MQLDVPIKFRTERSGLVVMVTSLRPLFAFFEDQWLRGRSLWSASHLEVSAVLRPGLAG